MIRTAKIREGVYTFKGISANELDFHGPVFRVDEGASYNAYLVMDENHVTLIDTLDKHLKTEFIDALTDLLGDRKIDSIIINHVEPDHSASYEAVKALYPNARSYCSRMAEVAMKRLFFGEHDYEVVEDLETRTFGNYTYTFVLTPFIHWPDNMITYMHEEKILFSNDAFGSLVTGTKLYDDEYGKGELFRHSKEYYANIVMPCSRFVGPKLAEILALNLEIDLVCPSHGIIWRSYIVEIITQYLKWANFEDVKDKAVIVYDTIWSNTEIMANEIGSSLANEGLEVKIFKASQHRPSLIMAEIMDAKMILVGSSNFNNTMVGPIADILERIHALKPQKKLGMAFGSYGWADVHLSRIVDRLKEAEVEIIETPMYTNYTPDRAKKIYAQEVAKKVADKLRNR